ncbi:MAG: hypothetical protein JNJ45_05715 [Chthonomonas sp.]|nr:hypothetical protein [Chthonomonas sp.]
MQDRLDVVWDEIERIQRDLAMAQRRNEPGAVRRARQALEALDQEHPGVQMSLADLYVLDHQSGKAIELYRKALERTPGDKEIENKMATAILAQSGDFGMPLSQVENVAEVKTNLLASMVVPGLGQVLSGDVKKGVVMMTVWGGFLLFGLLIPDGIRGMAGLFKSSSVPFNSLILLPLLGMGVVFALSWGDMAGRAKQVLPNRRERVSHPTPPVDKDFEIKL